MCILPAILLLIYNNRYIDSKNSNRHRNPHSNTSHNGGNSHNNGHRNGGNNHNNPYMNVRERRQWKATRNNNKNKHQAFLMSYSQINLGKRIAAMADINLKCANKKHFICLAQEPPLNRKGTPSGLDSQHQILHSLNKDKPIRSMIYAHKTVPIWLNHQLSSPDVAVGLWVTKDQDISRTVVVSAYWDILNTNPPPELIKAIEYAKKNNFALLIGIDTNCHSTLTGSKENNPRGNALDELIYKYDLQVANRGTTPTFDCHLGQTHIDATLHSDNLTNKIHDWKVQTCYNGSDHNTLTFDVKSTEPTVELKRNYNKLDIEELKEKLSCTDWIQSEWWTKQLIESNAAIFNGKLADVLDELIH